jgi:hypothetical protein
MNPNKVKSGPSFTNDDPDTITPNITPTTKELTMHNDIKVPLFQLSCCPITRSETAKPNFVTWPVINCVIVASNAWFADE